MDNVLITGTKGFIGSNLKKELEGKYQIIEVNENIFEESKWKEKLAHYFWLKPVAVFHIGACSNTLEKDVNYMMKVNYEFTKFLMNMCKTHSIPMIYSSSAANYGTNGEFPSNLYGWSKYTAEDYVISNGGVALRYFNVYGPGEQNKGKMASVAYQMFQKKIQHEEIKLFPDKPRRDFVYIKDIISANLFAWENYENVCGNWYEVGSGEANTFESVLDNMGINYSYWDRSVIPSGYQFYTCSTKNKWMDGWKSKWSLADGIKDYLEFLQNENN